MRIFFTRAGQTLPENYCKDEAFIHVGDIALSDLGETQARLLGKRLRELHFNGVVYSSPYDRAMRTANIVAEEFGIGFTPLPCLRGIFVRSTPDEKFTGLAAEEMIAKYPRAHVQLDMPYPWWEEKAEELSDVIERLKEGLQPVLSELPKDIDVLLVGHAAVSVALRHLFRCETDIRGFHWNCHLSLLYATDGKTYANDSEHLPETMRTGHALLYTDCKKAWEESAAKIRAFLQANEGEKVLHIGDTHSANYGYFKRLIEEVQPDVIVHTGNLVAELKAGENEELRSYWRAAASVLIRMLEETPARVLIAPSVNDPQTELAALVTRAEIVTQNALEETYGKRFSDATVSVPITGKSLPLQKINI